MTLGQNPRGHLEADLEIDTLGFSPLGVFIHTPLVMGVCPM